MPCRNFRENITRYKLPISHRDLSRVHYINRTLYEAWRYHLIVGNLQVPDVIFRKIVYDAIYDGLKNEYGKNHHKDFLREYEEFNRYFYENYSKLAEQIKDWEEYRRSDNYKGFLETVYTIKRLDHRLQTTTDMALAYMYSKYQKGWNAAETIIKIEKALKLDVIPKVWSKKWLWFATTLLVFDANNLYAKTIGSNQVKIIDYDVAEGEAIKIHITPWYERKDLEVSDYWKTMFRVYDEIVVPIIGEIGSVTLAEATRRGTVTALIHIARVLTNIAEYSRIFRGLTWGAKLLLGLGGILEGSILAWLGWQILVEWSLDRTIQAFMQEALKYIYAGLTGAEIWKPRNYVDWGLFEMATWYIVKMYKYGTITDEEKGLISFVLQYGSEKQKDILMRIMKAFQLAQALWNFRNREREIENRYRRDRNRWITEVLKDPNDWTIGNLDRTIEIITNEHWDNYRDFFISGLRIQGKENTIQYVNGAFGMINKIYNDMKEGKRYSIWGKELNERACPHTWLYAEDGKVEIRMFDDWGSRCMGTFGGCPISGLYLYRGYKPIQVIEQGTENIPDIYRDILKYLFCADQYLRGTGIINLKEDRIDLQLEPWYDLRKFLRAKIYERKDTICFSVVRKRKIIRKKIIGNFSFLPEFTTTMIRRIEGGSTVGIAADHGPGYGLFNFIHEEPMGVIEKRNFMQLFRINSTTYKFIADITYLYKSSWEEEYSEFGCSKITTNFSWKQYRTYKEFYIVANTKNQRIKSKRSKIICIPKPQT